MSHLGPLLNNAYDEYMSLAPRPVLKIALKTLHVWSGWVFERVDQNPKCGLGYLNTFKELSCGREDLNMFKELSCERGCEDLKRYKKLSCGRGREYPKLFKTAAMCARA